MLLFIPCVNCVCGIKRELEKVGYVLYVEKRKGGR
jgi:hypothetical protein